MQLTEKQVEEILSKRPESRYKYFIRTVVQEEEVWGLMDEEGWLMLEDDEDGTDVLPAFPNVEFAEMFQQKGGYEDFTVEALDLYEFIEWFDDLTDEKIKIGVFPTPEFQCAVLTPERVKEDLSKEFEKKKGE